MKKQWMLLFGIVMMVSVTALAGMAVMDQTDLNEITGQEGIHIYSWIGYGQGTISLKDRGGVTSDPAYRYTGVINWLAVYIDDGRGVNIELNDLTVDFGSSGTGKSMIVFGLPDIDGELYFSDIVVGRTAGTGRKDTGCESTWQFGNFIFEPGSAVIVLPH